MGTAMQAQGADARLQDQESRAGPGTGLWPEGCAVSVAMGEAGVWGAWGNLLQALSSIPFRPVGRPQEPPKRPGEFATEPPEITASVITIPIAIHSPPGCQSEI